MRHWADEPCAKCGARNLIDMGDSSDASGPDIEAWKCHSCGFVQFTDADLYGDGGDMEMDIADAYTVKGRKNIR